MPIAMNGPLTVYTPKLQHGKYYVGRTKQSLQTRIEAHARGKGAYWNLQV